MNYKDLIKYNKMMTALPPDPSSNGLQWATATKSAKAIARYNLISMALKEIVIKSYKSVII